LPLIKGQAFLFHPEPPSAAFLFIVADIYISHSLSSARFCDSVLVFHGGQIVECGTHDELMITDGRYAEMYRMQAGYYRN